MFENVPHFPGTQDRRSPSMAVVGALTAESHTAPTGNALRAIGWSELTARINAARDLREVLRRDSVRGGLSFASFGDAAASYFAAMGEGEQPVNPIALGADKASAANAIASDGEAAEGDRETVND